ncbi:MAG: DNA repair protein RecO [Nitrospirae bacterium]|nr:DNA repair protein RecO [Nitrospirota bacterium]
MLTRTEGIVLKTQKYGEADLIVTYLSSDKGIIKAFAKSPRKTKSRFGSSLEPLTHARISLWGKEQAALPKITQADILNSFHRIREDFQDFVNISRLVEILLSVMPDGAPNKRLFAFFLNVLHTIKASERGSKDALHLITRIRLLAAIGCAPRLQSCGRCGEKSLDFYPSSGTILCNKCAAPLTQERSTLRISNNTVRFYTHTIEWPIHISNRLKPRREVLAELSDLLDKHLTYLLSKKLNSSEFLVGANRTRAGASR